MSNTYVKIDENNKIVEAYGFEPESPFIVVPSSVWAQFSVYRKEDLAILNGEIVVVDESDMLSKIKTKKGLEFRVEHEGIVSIMTGNADVSEMASWAKQEAEARAWSADNNAATPIIDNLLIGRSMGETKAQLVAKIIAKADGYTVSYAQALGMYHAKQKALEACTTVEAVLAL